MREQSNKPVARERGAIEADQSGGLFKPPRHKKAAYVATGTVRVVRHFSFSEEDVATLSMLNPMAAGLFSAGFGFACMCVDHAIDKEKDAVALGLAALVMFVFAIIAQYRIHKMVKRIKEQTEDVD